MAEELARVPHFKLTALTLGYAFEGWKVLFTTLRYSIRLATHNSRLDR